MSVFWKGLVVLLLVLPVAAYVTGSLAGSQSELPDRQEPVLVGDSGATPSDLTGEPSPKSPGRGDGPGDDDDRGDDGRGDDGDRDERPQVVRPEPRDVGDDDDDDADDGERGDSDGDTDDTGPDDG